MTRMIHQSGSCGIESQHRLFNQYAGRYDMWSSHVSSISFIKIPHMEAFRRSRSAVAPHSRRPTLPPAASRASLGCPAATLCRYPSYAEADAHGAHTTMSSSACRSLNIVEENAVQLTCDTVKCVRVLWCVLVCMLCSVLVCASRAMEFATGELFDVQARP